jgi:hypothetical protein
MTPGKGNPTGEAGPLTAELLLINKVVQLLAFLNQLCKHSVMSDTTELASISHAVTSSAMISHNDGTILQSEQELHLDGGIQQHFWLPDLC